MSTQRLGEQLVEEGRLTEAQLRRALETRALVGGRLGTNLLELGYINEETLLETLGRLRATRTVDAAELRAVKADVANMIPAKLAMRYKLVPYLLKGKTIFVASADPGDPLQEDEISFLTSCMVRTCVALEVRLAIALRRIYGVPVDRRFLILGKRLSEGVIRPAAASQAPSAAAYGGANVAIPPSPPASPTPPPAQPAPTSMQAPPRVAPPASTPTTAEASSAQSRTRTPQRDEPQFIELDDQDLALLRRPAEDDAVIPDEGAVEPVDAGFEDAAPSGEADQDLADVIEPPPMEEDTSVEGRLRKASIQLMDAEIRDEIGDALLDFAGAYFARRVLLIARKERIFGWMGGGEGVTAEAVRSLDLESAKPSIFLGLKEASSFWLGPLPPLPSNQELVRTLGGEAPRDCIALPVTLRGKVVCYLYADNGPRGVAGAPVAELKRLVGKAGLAFEVYILKNKLRVL